MTDEHQEFHENARGNPLVQHEERDVRFGPVLIAGFGMLGLVVLGMVISFFFVQWTSDERQIVPVTEQLRNEPLMFDATSRSNQELLRKQQQRVRKRYLDSYDWVDQQGRIVHIPIERAIEIVAEQGELPSWEDDSGEATVEDSKTQGP